jgi:hypothetical protein
MAPNFSAYPFARLRTLSRREAAIESSLARWLAARGHGERLARLVGGPVRVDVVLARASDAGPVRADGSVCAHDAAGATRPDAALAHDAAGTTRGDAALAHDAAGATRPDAALARAFDPFAARCEIRVGGAAVEVRGSSLAVRAIAQRLLGGPAELGAPRPLGIVEKAVWALVVATALEDLGVVGAVWPVLDELAARDPASSRDVVELAVTLGSIALAVQIAAPADLLLRAPPVRTPPAWLAATYLELPIVLGRCALSAAALDRLSLRTVITLEQPAGDAELVVFDGAVGLRVRPGEVVAEVATGYVPRDMSLPDDAHVELTVALGTTRLSLRQLGELAIGQIIQLGRPLTGPFELCAAGRVVGRGELVDVDGELAVRIVSLGD